MVGSLVESQTAALVVSGRLFGRESNSGSSCKWTALWKRVKQRLWLQVDGSLEESQTAALVASGKTLWKRVKQRLWLRVDDFLEESRIAALFNKSDKSGYLETVKYVEG